MDVGRSSAAFMRSRRALLLGLVLVAALLVTFAVTRTDASRAPEARERVTVMSSNRKALPHQFTGSHHAPFISLKTYRPIHRHRDPRYLLVDVRHPEVRATGRIPGDLWVPLADASSTGWRFLWRYRDKTLVLYCDCPWAEAAEASAILKDKGFSYRRMRVLREGYPGWLKAGYRTLSGGDPCRLERRWPEACAA